MGHRRVTAVGEGASCAGAGRTTKDHYGVAMGRVVGQAGTNNLGPVEEGRRRSSSQAVGAYSRQLRDSVSSSFRP